MPSKTKYEPMPVRDFEEKVHLSIYGTITLCGRRVLMTELAGTKVTCDACKNIAKRR